MANNSNENVYNIDYSKPGIVLIINNQNFVGGVERKGSEKDVERILNTFEKLNFKTRPYMNQTSQQIKELKKSPFVKKKSLKIVKKIIKHKHR